ncbi:hypothetical protein NDU88_004328 [Pleurodeles waltl]|uniref:Uncharacterized protein n=1 Tax=Pleurodeles waltl TaxID=8319 RepID=A0AAV7T8T9_PLEWA|nr:hypothetical protein NDU88_004328 [Pleurodeles waltl]
MSRCAKLLGDAVGVNSTVPIKNYLWLDPVYEDTFSGAANILEADSASEDVMDNYDIPAQEVVVSKEHLDNLGRNVTYRSRLGESYVGSQLWVEHPEALHCYDEVGCGGDEAE